MGSRFWPLSTPVRPKQLLPLVGERPLIAHALERARALAPEDHVRILTGAHLVGAIQETLPEVSEVDYMVEPVQKGTCPPLVWAARDVARLDPDAVLVSLHADHVIWPLDAFRNTVESAIRLAREEALLVTVGVVPDRVETGFGHIEPGATLTVDQGHEAFRVASFHEKPDPATAERYRAEGHLWNTGIFVWKAAVFLEEVRRHAPEVATHLPLLDADGAAAFFDAVPPCVVDRTVLERSRRVGCVRATFEWDDVGSWEALTRTRDADASGNVVVGSGRVVDGSENVVVADQGRVVLFGVNDLVVVRTEAETLVMPRHRAGDLKALLDALEEAT
jgi:mannose-1-phosphate guanylyltransferase